MEPMFAKYAGTRPRAMIESPAYQFVDEAHDGGISHLSGVTTAGSGVARTSCDAGSLPVGTATEAGEAGACSDSDHDDNSDTYHDAGEEFMTGVGQTIALLFGIFVDGVLMHKNGKATTTIISVKCLDLPAFLCQTELASYTWGFIGGKKEPTCMTQILDLLLQQFKNHELSGRFDENGERSLFILHVQNAMQLPEAFSTKSYSTKCQMSL